MRKLLKLAALLLILHYAGDILSEVPEEADIVPGISGYAEKLSDSIGSFFERLGFEDRDQNPKSS